MLELPRQELALFVAALVLYLTAAGVGVRQLLSGGERYRRLLMPIISLGIVAEMLILVLRAGAIKAVPLTGLFESMIVLTIAFGLIYICLSFAIEQVWFSSMMAWAITALVVMAAVVAKPASEPQPVASAPWAIVHGAAMALGAASVAFSAATALLYLMGKRRLKQKRVMQVIGKVPNIERLETISLAGLRAGFVFVTVGLVSGLGLSSLTGVGVVRWLLDAKVVCIIAAWLILAAVLLLNHLLSLGGRVRAYLTLAAFALIVFAILGVTILGATRHDFSVAGALICPVTGYA